MMDVSVFKNRLKEMTLLPFNWDGWGSHPISEKVYDIANCIFDNLKLEEINSVKILVGVDEPYSLVLIFEIGNREVDMVVYSTGIIEYDDTQAGAVIGSGSFYFSKETLVSILY